MRDSLSNLSDSGLLLDRPNRVRLTHSHGTPTSWRCDLASVDPRRTCVRTCPVQTALLLSFESILFLVVIRSAGLRAVDLQLVGRTRPPRACALISIFMYSDRPQRSTPNTQPSCLSPFPSSSLITWSHSPFMHVGCSYPTPILACWKAF